MEKYINVQIITTFVQKMTTLLRPGIYSILKVLYTSKPIKIHVRELSRKTGLYGQSLMRYLKILEQKKLIVFSKQGNLKLYSFLKNQNVFSLFTLFDIERVEKLPLLRKNAVQEFVSHLPSPPIYVILFGSTAKGNYTDNSDIDILLVNHSNIDTSEVEKRINAIQGIRVSIFQMSYADFIKEIRMKEKPVIQSALATGFPLCNHIRYYEEIFV